jgi:hypothetical protein
MPNYPVPYQNNWNYGSGIGQQLFPQYTQSILPQTQQVSQTPQQNGPGLIWVDGEVGAKAYQMPSGWPSNQPIALWDTNDTIIYLKSTNPMGMPNPLQRAHYTLESMQSGEKTYGFSGEVEKKCNHDMSEYVRKDDMERMKQELMDAINGASTNGASGTRRTTKGEG